MIRCILIDANDTIILTDDVSRIQESGIKRYFVNFDQPTDAEKQKLIEVFDFHPLAIEDCFHYLQRPKLEYYTEHSFFVLHALDEGTLTSREINLFASDRHLVSYHEQSSPEIDIVFEPDASTNKKRSTSSIKSWTRSSMVIFRSFMRRKMNCLRLRNATGRVETIVG